jgi:hypothetical protein
MNQNPIWNNIMTTVEQSQSLFNAWESGWKLTTKTSAGKVQDIYEIAKVRKHSHIILVHK